MSSFTDERAAKVAGNLAKPEKRPVEVFKVELHAAGIDPTQVSTERFRKALDLKGKAIDTMSPATVGFVEQRSRLSFIIDALGPKGANILTEEGILLVRAAEIAQDEIHTFDSSYDQLNAFASNYAEVRSIIDSGLEAFEGIVGIVETRKLEGGGELLPFDMSNFRDVRLSQTLKGYVDQWVTSRMGDPKLIGLSADELLVACSNFPEADRKAFDLLHPEQAGKVTGEYFSYSISSEFEAISLQTITREDGTKAIFKGVDPGPQTQIPSGPLDR